MAVKNNGSGGATTTVAPTEGSGGDGGDSDGAGITIAVVAVVLALTAIGIVVAMKKGGGGEKYVEDSGARTFANPLYGETQAAAPPEYDSVEEKRTMVEVQATETSGYIDVEAGAEGLYEDPPVNEPDSGEQYGFD